MGHPWEQERSESEQRFRALAEYATELMIELGPDGSTLFASPSVEDTLGWSPEEFVGHAPLDLVHPDDRRETALAYASVLRAEGRVTSVHRARHRDGSWRWLHDTARSFRSASGELHVVVLGRDISEQKQAEEALEQQLAIQARVAELSRHFVSIAPEDVDAGIRDSLAVAASLAGAQRTRLLAVDPVRARVGAFYEWVEAGVDPSMPPIDAGAPLRFHWTAQRLARGEVVHVPRFDALPPEATAERADWPARGVRAQLSIPVHSGDALIGFQIFERVSEEGGWSEREITLLRLVGEIFAGAIERRDTALALRESEERFRAIAEHATELLAEFDAKGHYVWASPSFASLLGRRPEALVGTSANALIHPDDYANSRARFTTALELEGESHSVHRLKHADGRWLWFDNAGRAYRTATGEVRFVSIGRDITQRVEMAAALEHQLAVEQHVASLSRKLLGLSGDDIEPVIRGALEETGRLAQADRCYLFAGLETPETTVLYEWCAEGVASWPGEARPWSQRMLARGKTLQFERVGDLPEEAVLERESLRRRGILSVLAIPVRSRNRTVGLIGFEAASGERGWAEHDVTMFRLVGEILTGALRRRLTDAALRESQAQLAQSQKLEAVGRLAGGIAHDFNNLLTVILGFARPLLRELPEGDPVRDDLVEIHGAAERAAALTRQLLTFSRRQIVESHVVDLNATLAGLEGLLGRLLGEDVELVLDLDPTLAGVQGDPHQFEQVVVNLAANARDAMPEGGTLRIETRSRSLDDVQAARLGLRPGPHVLVSVADTGQGMDDETRVHIFEPFFTTKDPGEGTGLGLSIAYSVVEQSRGAIRVDDEARKGTRFEIWLPAAGEARAQSARVATDGGARGEGCVLLVEDEPSVRRLTSRILTGAGYEVLEAEDGERALEIASSHPGRIDALVSDVVMPRIGGYELARRLRAVRPELALLFISGYPEDRGHDGPPDDAGVVAKPFTEDALLAGLRERLER